jgi:YesN/AraC family two-component response regulator
VDQASDQLRLQLEYSRSLAQTQYLTGLINGNFSDQEEIQRQAHQVGIELPPHSAFYAIILQADPPVHHSVLDAFPDIWEEALDESLNGYKVSLSADKGTVWIIHGEPGQIERNRWEWIQTKLSKHAMSNVHFGIGQAYNDLLQLPQSYLEAYTALYYKPIFGDCSLLFHQDDASETTNVVWYPKAELAKLDLILKQGDPESALPVIDEIMDKIRRNNANYFMAKSICFDIMYTFSKTVLQMETKIDNQTEYSQQMFRIMEINTFEGIQEHTYAFCSDLLNVMKALAKPQKPELLQLIETYIAETAYSNQFSIQGMSRDLSLSTTYLGKYFKEQTGITLLDFVTRFRIERAKHLLAQSDLPLQDIVEQTGATNVSSFIRKFKKTMAMTPGEYRTLVKDQKVNNGS